MAFVAGMLIAVVQQVAEVRPGLDELRVALEAAVDLPTAVARKRAANELGGRKDATVEQWLELARSFGRFERGEGGARVEVVDLPVLEKVEHTELCVHVPRGYDAAKAAPLLLAFHGTGGGGGDMLPMWTRVADELGILVVAPTEAGANEGYAFSDRERAAALAAMRWARRRYDVDEERVYLTGISRGGHLAWDLVLRWPDRFAAAAPMIGSPRFNLTHGQNNLRFVENVVRLPIRDLQGSKDDPAVLENLHLAFAKLDGWKALDAKLVEFPELGHSFELDAVDWKAWLGGAKRVTVPKTVVRAACEKGEARAFWVEITALHKDVQEDLRPRVEAETWNAMDEHARRVWLEKEVEKHTARLEATMDAPGVFTAKGELVLGFRLLLAREMFDPAKPVVVTFNGKRFEKRATPSSKVLLQELVERFDRSFLPIASIDVP